MVGLLAEKELKIKPPNQLRIADCGFRIAGCRGALRAPSRNKECALNHVGFRAALHST